MATKEKTALTGNVDARAFLMYCYIAVLGTEVVEVYSITQQHNEYKSGQPFLKENNYRLKVTR